MLESILLPQVDPSPFKQAAYFTDVPVQQFVNSAVNAPEGIYLTGGNTTDSNRVNYLFDPTANTFARKADTPMSISSHAAIYVNGKLYLHGGINGTQYQGLLFRYDPVINQWVQLATGPAVYAHGFVEFNNKLYIFSGLNAQNQVTEFMHVYDIATNTWAQLPRQSNWPVSRGHYGWCRVGNRGFLHGGYRNDAIFAGQMGDAWLYDFVSNTWTRCIDSPVPMHTHQIDELNGNIYTGGAWSNNHNDVGSDRIFEYNPRRNQWRRILKAGYSYWSTRWVIRGGVGFLIGGSPDATPASSTRTIWKVS